MSLAMWIFSCKTDDRSIITYEGGQIPLEPDGEDFMSNGLSRDTRSIPADGPEERGWSVEGRAAGRAGKPPKGFLWDN